MYGIFIGSFNPPTLAHLEISLLLKEKYDKIVFIPVNSKEKNLVSMQKRIDMLSIYQRKYPFIEIDNIMDNYSFLNYRIINLIKKKYGNIELIIGSDLLEKLDSFDEYELLLESYSFVVITRNNVNILEMIKKKYSRYQDKFWILKYNNNISSSMVRNCIKNNQDLKGLLHEDIIRYIKNNHLYV